MVLTHSIPDPIPRSLKLIFRLPFTHRVLKFLHFVNPNIFKELSFTTKSRSIYGSGLAVVNRFII